MVMTETSRLFVVQDQLSVFRPSKRHTTASIFAWTFTNVGVKVSSSWVMSRRVIRGGTVSLSCFRSKCLQVVDPSLGEERLLHQDWNQEKSIWCAVTFFYLVKVQWSGMRHPERVYCTQFPGLGYLIEWLFGWAFQQICTLEDLCITTQWFCVLFCVFPVCVCVSQKSTSQRTFS